MDDALKTRDIKYSNVETWLLFAPPIKIYGYAPSAAYFNCDESPSENARAGFDQE